MVTATYYMLTSIVFSVEGLLDVNVDGINHLSHLIKVPYEAQVTLQCSGRSAEVLTFINTTLDLDDDITTGISPYLFFSTNVTIHHFKSSDRGFYSCVSNISTTTPERILLTSDEHEVNITDIIQKHVGSSIYTTIIAKYAAVPEDLLQWYFNEQPVGSNTIFNVQQDGLSTLLRFKHEENQTFGTFMLKVNGTNLMDSIKLPKSQTLSNVAGIINPVKSVFNKILQMLGIRKLSSQDNLISTMDSNIPSNPLTITTHRNDQSFLSSSQPLPNHNLIPSVSSQEFINRENSSSKNLRDRVLNVIASLKNFILNKTKVFKSSDIKDNILGTGNQSAAAKSSILSPQMATKQYLTTAKPFSKPIPITNQYYIQSTKENHDNSNTLLRPKEMKTISSTEVPTTIPYYQPTTEKPVPVSTDTTTLFMKSLKKSLPVNVVLRTKESKIDSEHRDKTQIRTNVNPAPSKVTSQFQDQSSWSSSFVTNQLPSPARAAHRNINILKKNSFNKVNHGKPQSSLHSPSRNLRLKQQNTNRPGIIKGETLQLSYPMLSPPSASKNNYDNYEKKQPTLSFDGFYVTVIKDLIEHVPKLPYLLNKGMQWLKEKLVGVGKHFNIDKQNGYPESSNMNGHDTQNNKNSYKSYISQISKPSTLQSHSSHLTSQNQNSESNNANSYKTQNMKSGQKRSTSQPGKPKEPQIYSSQRHSPVIPNNQPEHRMIDERGQLAGTTEPIATHQHLSTPVIVALALLISGALLFVVSLIIIAVSYLKFHTKVKVSETELESGNNRSSLNDGPSNNFIRNRIITV